MDKNLKKLSRVELLELMIGLSEDREALIAENNRLKQMLSAQRLPRSTKVGSIAEAALAANGYFESAQRSADEYLREIKHLRDEIARNADARGHPQGASRVELSQAQAQARRIVARANAQAEAILADARSRAEETIADANRQSHAIMLQAQRRASAVSPSASRDAQVGFLGSSAIPKAQPAYGFADATVELPPLRGRHTRAATDGGL